MYKSFVWNRLRLEVKHRRPAPNRYTWEIFREHELLPVEESYDQFSSWEEASLVGNRALKKIVDDLNYRCNVTLRDVDR